LIPFYPCRNSDIMSETLSMRVSDSMSETRMDRN
jgi:hypothetical protein